MRHSNWEAVIQAAMGPAASYLASLPDRPVYRPTDPEEVRALLAGPFPEEGTNPEQVVAALARDLEPYLSAHASGRYFGFVIGGLHPAAYGAELLVSTWDQNAGLYAAAPGVAIAEEVAESWVLDALNLPNSASVGFVTGGQMATFTCLAAARHQVLRETGWNVEADGLQGAPKVNIVVKTERHSTVPRALRHLGLGDSSAIEVLSDSEARIDTEALERTLLNLEGPTIVCVEAGNINHGSFDDYQAVGDIADRHRERGNPSWVHVDGAFGLWARASTALSHLTDGLERLDSWSTDAHKMLNVGYDSGLAICKHSAAHRAAMSVHAAYLIQAHGEVRDQMDWNPDFSRRARGLGVYAALRSLGRSGVDDMISRTCRLARLFADRLSASGLVEVVNDVVFNQVLIRWLAPDGDQDAFTDRLLARARPTGQRSSAGQRGTGSGTCGSPWPTGQQMSRTSRRQLRRFCVVPAGGVQLADPALLIGRPSISPAVAQGSAKRRLLAVVGGDEAGAAVRRQKSQSVGGPSSPSSTVTSPSTATSVSAHWSGLVDPPGMTATTML